ncbi:alpha-L-fucosidase [Paenibacillus apiarius]|uniref:alpha-L-fucosidase n=1 Tax=Paenibacillus apiarius TaxID=46240 RepID=A0ABT4DUY1_9BACL|nr:alpha-L-fucosidase [Paenibacillus apiarius]MCY9514402.1 alpha-L-fucosidase [Paenibacillus apiarius]MCY9521060.1 alpha-L-fucosidase [Paenibacillus apiarius]MCY9551907.1 alpha-L-fucosidase [Paenibacillus apiarius]MCY9557794.1 alpha-L-fucosidase [Paenibacillus apiarius]MCY9684481.1 alpha-L-fucosidase [Paenibacillus apiarius]
MTKTKLALPTPQQIAWQDLELGMFFHFGINTYCDQEWGDGTDSPELFNPAQLDARQWIRTASEAGFKYVILTAKHHDGFCLWPTKTTAYSVQSSPWKNGQGDVVREVADACREEGMLLGLYVSPWDRNAACYSDPAAYDDFYAEQLTELLTGYGPLVEVWFDGAGSEGRQYDWPRIIGLVKQHQPDAMIFNMGAPTIRWVGNEDGVAPYPCWNTADSARVSMFTSDMNTWLEATPEWVPAECDVPIRARHWFWHPDDESSLHSLDHLLDLYYRSVGHGTTLLLNVSPDDRGLLPDSDVERVREFGTEIRRRFGQCLAETKGSGTEVMLDWGAERPIDHVIAMEDITYGERVRAYKVEALVGGEWKQVAQGSAIGHKKIDRIEPLQTASIRLRISECVEEPIIRYLAVYSTKNETDEEKSSEWLIEAGM